MRLSIYALRRLRPVKLRSEGVFAHETSSLMDNIKSNLPFIILISVACVLIFCITTNGHDWGGDFSAYIMQARSLTEGTPLKFIEENRYAMRQSTRPIGPEAYPWGFPLLLMPLFSVFGMNLIALKLVGIISYLLFLLLLWFGFRNYHSRLWIFCFVGLFALNPYLLTFLDNILSDIPFLLVSTFSVLLIGMRVVEKRVLFSPGIDYFLLGASIAAAYFIRTNGLLILVTLAITQIIAKLLEIKDGEPATGPSPATFKGAPSHTCFHIGKLFIPLSPYVTFFCIALVWEIFLPEGGASHASALAKTSPEHLMRNLKYYFELPLDFLVKVPLKKLLWWTSIPVALFGVIQRRHSYYHMIIYVFLTVLLYIHWPGTEGLRFIFPVIPFYGLFVLAGVTAFQAGTTDRERLFRKTVGLLPFILVLFCFALNSVKLARKNLAHHRELASGPFTAASMNMFKFIEQNTERNSIVIFFKPRVMRMLTGRQSLMICKPEQITRGNYFVLYLKERVKDQVSPESVINLTKQGYALLVYENSEFRVYYLTGSHKAL